MTPPLFQLATRPRHLYGAYIAVPATASISGAEQIERTCEACGAVRVTLLLAGGNAVRLWRRAGESAQLTIEPACEVVATTSGATA